MLLLLLNTPAVISPASGSSAGTSTASAAGASLAASAGTSAGSSTATGVGSSSATGSASGSSAGTSTATGAGASTAASAGASAGASAASGVGSSSATGSVAGSAAGTSAASGSGAATAASSGASAGTSAASGVAASPASIGPGLFLAMASAGSSGAPQQHGSDGLGSGYGDMGYGSDGYGEGTYTPLPMRLMGAIFARFKATPALLALLPGGLHKGLAPPKTAPGYAEIFKVGAPAARSTGATVIRREVYRVRFFCTTDTKATLAALAWEGVFNPQMVPLDFQTGYTMSVACSDEHEIERDDRAASATSLFGLALTMECMTGINVPQIA